MRAWPRSSRQLLSIGSYLGLVTLCVVGLASAHERDHDRDRNDWPSYNNTPTGERFSHLSQINTSNAGELKVLCSYDTHQMVSFQSSTWSTITLDPVTGTLYVPSGNAAPDFDKQQPVCAELSRCLPPSDSLPAFDTYAWSLPPGSATGPIDRDVIAT